MRKATVRTSLDVVLLILFLPIWLPLVIVFFYPYMALKFMFTVVSAMRGAKAQHIINQHANDDDGTDGSAGSRS